jgi:hypothetical protein
LAANGHITDRMSRELAEHVLALRARAAELESALLDVRAKAKDSNRSDTLHGRDLVFSMTSQQGAYVARLRGALGEIEHLAAAAGSVGEREARDGCRTCHRNWDECEC